MVKSETSDNCCLVKAGYLFCVTRDVGGWTMVHFTHLLVHPQISFG